MSIDIKLLIWSVVLTLLQTVIAVIGAQMQVGLPMLASNREKLPEILGWAGRAHRNMLENLVLFGVLVLVAQAKAGPMPRPRWAPNCSSGPGSPMP